MKHYVLVLFITVNFLLPSTTYAVTYLHYKTINNKAVEIEKKITRDRYIGYSLAAIGIIHELYQWVPMMRSCFGNTYQGKEQINEKKSIIEAFCAGLSSLFYTQEGWISIAHAGLNIGGFIMISKVGEQFVHPDTLRWFIYTYASYEATIDLMQKRLLILRNDDLESEQTIIHREFLQLLHARLIQQNELICAYMIYKSKRLTNEESLIAQKTIHSFFTMHNSWLQQIAAQWESDSSNYDQCHQLLEAYKTEIASHLKHFSTIEGESLRDRAIIQKQIKKSALLKN
ncbi:MAG TPA: hypothetical protein VLB80_04810 [Candidatus Babeliales bacterium]|nr:hypothetical protein [Candidatus Babeliales bacterium]